MDFPQQAVQLVANLEHADIMCSSTVTVTMLGKTKLTTPHTLSMLLLCHACTPNVSSVLLCMEYLGDYGRPILTGNDCLRHDKEHISHQLAPLELLQHLASAHTSLPLPIYLHQRSIEQRYSAMYVVCAYCARMTDYGLQGTTASVSESLTCSLDACLQHHM